MRRPSTTEFVAPSRRRPNLPLHIGGAALLFVAAGILVSALVELGAGGDEVPALLGSAGLVAAVGAVAWRSTSIPERTSASATLAAVGATWVLASLAGTVPYVLSGTFPTVDAALFESVSGFTGTGSTVLSPISTAPRGVLFWRNMTQWYGGTGMIVLAVAILPFLGVGGMDLLRSEAPGPTADRLAPRVSETAKRLWLVYGAFTVVAAIVLLVVGLSPFDAVTHAFTVVSTGGLSPHDDSIGHFGSLTVELAFVALMLFGAVNFGLHWRAFSGTPRSYWDSAMFRFYVGMFASFTAVVTVLLWLQQDLSLGRSLRDAVFNVTTLLTSTGYTTTDYAQWAPGVQLLLFALMFTGGMAGSTSGGLKLIRVRVLLRHAAREVKRIRRPRAVLPVRLGDEPVTERIVQRVVGYSLLYVLLIGVGTLVVSFLGSDFLEAGGGVVSVMGNMGPAFGEAGPASNYLYFTRPARAVLMVLMLAGRLEIFPVIFLISRIVGPTTMARRRMLGSARRSVRSSAGSLAKMGR